MCVTVAIETHEALSNNLRRIGGDARGGKGEIWTALMTWESLLADPIDEPSGRHVHGKLQLHTTD